MDKLSRKILAWALPLAFALAAAMPALAFAGGDSVTATTSDEFVEAMQSYTNHEVILGDDIEVSGNIQIHGSAMSLNLDGHRLTMHGWFAIEDDGASLTVKDTKGGSIDCDAQMMFLFGDSDRANSTKAELKIEGGSFNMKGGPTAGALIYYSPNRAGDVPYNGVTIKSGRFTNENDYGSILYATSTDAALPGKVTIENGVFEADSNCIQTGSNVSCTIEAGSFYSENETALLIDDEGAFTNKIVFVNGTEMLDGYGSLPFADLRDKGNLVQVGWNMSAFADVEVVSSNENYGSVTLLNGPKAYVGAKLYPQVQPKKGYCLLLWAYTDTHVIITDSETLNYFVPDTPFVSITAAFCGDLKQGSASLSTTSYAYNGKARTPGVTVKNAAGTKLTKGTDYTVSYASGRKAVGTYKVKVQGDGEYIGSLTKSFKIVPAKPAIYTPSSASKRTLTVKASKKPSAGGGKYYQVAYRQVGSSKWYKKSYSTQSVKLTKLKSGKAYYVKVRSYKKIDGKTYVSAWSTTKKSGKVK